MQAFAPDGALASCGAELRAVHLYQKNPPEAMNAMRDVIKCALPSSYNACNSDPVSSSGTPSELLLVLF